MKNLDPINAQNVPYVIQQQPDPQTANCLVGIQQILNNVATELHKLQRFKIFLVLEGLTILTK